MSITPEPKKPKARFSVRIEGQDYLDITIWRGKKEPNSEVISADIRRLRGDSWETVARLALYRTSLGQYRQLPDRQVPDTR